MAHLQMVRRDSAAAPGVVNRPEATRGTTGRTASDGLALARRGPGGGGYLGLTMAQPSAWIW